MKHVPILAAIVLGIVLLIQHGTDAGPTAPRAVPVVTQEVMQPSKMVARTLQWPGGTRQIPINLPVGTVFILTSWTAHMAGGAATFWLAEGSTENPDTFRDSMTNPDNAAGKTTTGHHVFPTGIRFPRDAAGKADIWVIQNTNNLTLVSVQGYITDDF